MTVREDRMYLRKRRRGLLVLGRLYQPVGADRVGLEKLATDAPLHELLRDYALVVHAAWAVILLALRAKTIEGRDGHVFQPHYAASALHVRRQRLKLAAIADQRLARPALRFQVAQVMLDGVTDLNGHRCSPQAVVVQLLIHMEKCIGIYWK